MAELFDWTLLRFWLGRPLWIVVCLAWAAIMLWRMRRGMRHPGWWPLAFVASVGVYQVLAWIGLLIAFRTLSYNRYWNAVMSLFMVGSGLVLAYGALKLWWRGIRN